MSRSHLSIAVRHSAFNRLETCLDTFLLHQEASHHTSKTLTHYRYTLRKFLDYLADRDIETAEDIEPGHIRAFLAHLQSKGYKDTTLHAHARAIKTFLNFLVDEEMLSASPMRKVAMPKLEKKIHPPFSQAEIKALLGACQGEYALRDRAIILCLLDSGLRAAEFVAMNVGDVDKAGLFRVHGKGQKDRYVRLGARARKAMLKYLALRRAQDDAGLGGEPGDPLWVGRRGRLTTNGLGKLIRRLGKRAGVEPCHPHRFRRTFAIWALRGGMDPYSLRAIMGHADMEMVLTYLDLVKGDIEEAHKRASPVDRFLSKKRR